MGKTKESARKRLRSTLAIITGVAFAGGIVIAVWSLKLPFPYWQSLFVSIPLLAEAFGSFGALFHWFDSWIIRSGRIIGMLQWIAGILGVMAIFDFVMRVRIPGGWIADGAAPIIFDSILILLFVLWMVASHFINETAREQNACEFC